MDQRSNVKTVQAVEPGKRDDGADLGIAQGLCVAAVAPDDARCRSARSRFPIQSEQPRCASMIRRGLILPSRPHRSARAGLPRRARGLDREARLCVERSTAGTVKPEDNGNVAGGHAGAVVPSLRTPLRFGRGIRASW